MCSPLLKSFSGLQVPLKSNRNFYFLFLILNSNSRIPDDLASDLTLCHSALNGLVMCPPFCYTNAVLTPLAPKCDSSAQGMLTPFLWGLASSHPLGLSFPIWTTIILIPGYGDWPLNWSSHLPKRPFLTSPPKSASCYTPWLHFLCFLVRFLAICASVCVLYVFPTSP